MGDAFGAFFSGAAGEELPDPRAREERRVQIRALDGSEEMPSEKTLIEAPWKCRYC